MHRLCLDKQAMHERHRHAKRAVKKDRTQSRDDKYAGRAGPPDCAEVDCAGETEAGEAVDVAEAEVNEREDSVAGWDIVGGDEHLHSPGSFPPPCTSRTRARCTVS